MKKSLAMVGRYVIVNAQYSQSLLRYFWELAGEEAPSIWFDQKIWDHLYWY